MNKQQLSSKIWAMANVLRGKVDANDYKDFLLGIIFYKFLSVKEENFMISKGMDSSEFNEYLTDTSESSIIFCQKNLGYFISYDNLFSTWISADSDFTVDNLHVALSAFERYYSKKYNKIFKGIFTALETGLSKLGTNTSQQTKACYDLIHLVNQIPVEKFDVLGHVYEDLIRHFAESAGKKSGEFYTPTEVSILMSEIVATSFDNKTNIQIFDPTSGSGSLLIHIGEAAKQHNINKSCIQYYAQELNQQTYNITRMNLVMRDITPSNIITRNDDTLATDWPFFDESDPENTYNPLYVDAVVSNPPYSANWDPDNKELDPRFADYGLAPKSTADYAFLLHGLYHLNPQGLMTIVLPHGVLFRGGSEGLIRERLIEKRQIEAIIGLPPNIFFGTGIPTIIMVLSKRLRHDDGVLIIDASKYFIKDGKQNKLQASDIKRISDAVKERKDIENFCRVVPLEEIRANDYNLNIPRYVDTSAKPESWDIYASMFGGIPVDELNELNKFWKVFPSLQADLFESNTGSTLNLKNENIREVVENNSDVVNYKERYKQALSSFDLWLSEELLEEPTLVSRSTEEDQIAKELFSRLEGIPLVDKYDAYQQLDNAWTIINSDLEEIIEKQSLEIARTVEPLIVEKNKKEVQEGWQGRTIPFELAQQELLADDLLAIKSLNNRLDAISSELDEIFESLTEEERASEITNDAEDCFNKSAFNKYLKTADTSEGTLGSKIKKANKLVTEEKQIGKQIKELSSKLDNKTIALIQNLTDEQIKNLLEKKWITPLMTSILALSNNAIENLVSNVTSLHKKYDTSLLDLENEIQSTELELCESLAQLTGNDADMQGIAELISLLGGEK